ncbi:MAG: M14 family metallopeptidase [Vicinamibacterales bacterium]|nr:M14 family metallopeptidase [Vicinamibacterales bacterium]
MVKTVFRMCRISVAAMAAFVVAIPAVAQQAGAVAQPAAGLSPQALSAVWDAEKVSWPVPPLVRHPDVEAGLRQVQQATPDLFSLEQIGLSVEGRSINHLWFGRGPMRVLLWSQMHGDEPTATAALFDILEYVRRHREEPHVRRLLDALTIHVVPMLNPDGAERFQRRNAQGIDINRDARRLQTPEGRILKALRDRLNPDVGFNLHNQNWRTSAGNTREPASVSLLSVAFDEARTESPGRLLTKQICAVIRDALEPLAPGRIGRYDDEFEGRAFGDNITKWGTSVVLIETGPWPSEAPDPYLVRLNFVALVTSLDALASGRVRQADKARYESLPMNGSNLFYVLIRNAAVVPGTGVAPFTADVGIVGNRVVREVEGQLQAQISARIDDLGDLEPFGALEDIDATGLVLVPLFDPALKAGDTTVLPDWTAKASGQTIGPGQPAQLLLLRQDGAENKYQVVRVIRF